MKSRVGTRRLRAGTCRLGQVIGLGTVGWCLPGGRRMGAVVRNGHRRAGAAYL